METKLCNKCNTHKSTTLFCKQSSKPSELQPHCIQCKSSYNQQWRTINQFHVKRNNHKDYLKRKSIKGVENDPLSIKSILTPLPITKPPKLTLL